MAQWLDATVTENRQWHPTLFSLKVSCTAFDFTAGQFVRLALTTPEGRVQRAYSLVNSPDSSEQEFLLSTVAEGELSPLLQQLQSGDTVQLSQPASGFFVLNEVPAGDNLWLMASGTGIGPYLSMLGTPELWQRFEHIVLVHSVRTGADLVYQALIQAARARHPGQLHYQPIVTRETVSGALQQRLPALISSGSLQQACQQPLNSQSQVMLCGNPEMIKSTKQVLEECGLRPNLRRAPGNITVEQYWK